MKKDNIFYILADGQRIPVSKDVYDAYWKYTNKEDYFMRLMKKGRSIRDPETGEKIRVSSQEVSYDQLLEEYEQFAADGPSLEDQVVIPIWIDELLCEMEPKERMVIRGVIWYKKSGHNLYK